jgi:hypothetical protein
MQEATSNPDFRARWAWIAAVALAATLPYALKIAADNDLWWHVRTGQMILTERALPATDPFSFTASGSAWTNHEWLSDVVVAGLYGLGGDRALSAWRMGLLYAVLACLTTLLWRRLPHPLPVLAGVLLVTPLIRVLVNLRPHSYTYLFALLLLWILESTPRRRALMWAVPPLMVLWTNLHGGFILGLGILAVVLAARWLGLDDTPTPPDVAERRRLACIFGLSGLATMINPYGPGLFAYLARELGADHSLILEWQGIWGFPQHRVHFVLLGAIPLLAVALARRLRPVAPVVLLAVSALATWVHGRFLILLVIFSSLVTFSALAACLERYPLVGRGSVLDRLRRPGWAWALCALPLLAALAQFTRDLDRKGLRLEIDPLAVPVEACEFLRRHDLGPNLLLRFDWGGYAIWHLYPDYKVSGDGRNLTVYEAGFVDGMLRAYHGGRFTHYAREYDVNVILSEAAGPTYHELRSHDEWVPVHRDRVAAIFVRPDVVGSLSGRVIDAPAIQPRSERFYFP